ncbi:TMV resistance protein N isoform X4 [Quercus suber]|uniref:TMV resistance protein N isoform X4 n=1 Tax=Quercus suber TaxID=58331 RepID=UPI0032DF97B5
MALVKRKRESSLSPSSSSTRQPKYHVFLSFRGEDTRTNFTDHLYVALKQKGIITFRDKEELKKGERISELFKAIEESQFAIIILSRNYASSTWCLDELAKIIKCKDEIGLEVLPVFYSVSPSIVRKQTETFEQAFIDHQERFEDNIEKVETWRDTLKKVADIKGWDLHLQNSSQPKKLVQLDLKDSRIEYLWEGRSINLKWLPAPVKLSIWSQPLSQWLSYDERCSRKVFTILFHFLQVKTILVSRR